MVLKDEKIINSNLFYRDVNFFKMISGFIISKIVAIYTGPSGIVLFGQIQSIVSALNGVINSRLVRGLFVLLQKIIGKD